MKVRCLQVYPDADQLATLGPAFFRERQFFITEGEIYLVLGLSFLWNARLFGSGMTLQVKNDYGRPTWAPACLFEIIDSRVSSYWELKIDGDGDVHLWPPSFYRDYYHDDLSEEVPAVLEDYKRVVALLQAETSSDVQ